MRNALSPLPAFRAAAFGLVLLAVPGLAGCETLGLSEGEPTLADMPADLAVDAFLWQGALETLSFLPPGSATPSTGRIETGWGSVSGNATEEVQVTVQIYPGPISPNSVAVGVQRRVNGVPAGVDPATAPTVQEAILLRARQLKAAIETE